MWPEKDSFLHTLLYSEKRYLVISRLLLIGRLDTFRFCSFDFGLSSTTRTDLLTVQAARKQLPSWVFYLEACKTKESINKIFCNLYFNKLVKKFVLLNIVKVNGVLSIITL